MKFSAGFTLIELLVVIAITAVVGTMTLANFRPFGEDQKLKSAVLDIQSLLVQAQTYASANAICQNKSGAAWQVGFVNNTTVTLGCTDPGGFLQIKKTFISPADIELEQVSGTGIGCPSSIPFLINYTLLSGKYSFSSASCTSLTVSMKNTQTNSTKSLTIVQEGQIHVN
jgi:prepilin-type N-terminal cleavage/methylation domain-containing protein